MRRGKVIPLRPDLRKLYIAWIEVSKEDGESKAVICDQFLAKDDGEARMQAKLYADSWPETQWARRQVVKIWEVIREVPVE